MSIRIVIVYHSGFGHTQRQADAVADGARTVPGTEVVLQRADAVDWALLAAADALVFGCPTYMGSVSAPFKAFMDASARAWQAGAWRDKLAAAFTTSGGPSGDKLMSLVQLAGFAAQHGMLWLGVDQPTGDLNRLGGWLGAMAQAGLREPATVSPGEEDLRVAAYLGRRVATAAKRWRAGSEASTEQGTTL